MPQLDGAVRTKMRDELGLNNKDHQHCAVDGQENWLLVAQHSDFDWLGQAVRLTPAEFWDQRGVRYCALSLATF